MNREEILNMPAGRKMDALIAEKVVGLRLDWEFAEFQNGEPSAPTLRDKYDEIGVLPFYSTDISATWEVIEKMGDIAWSLASAWNLSGKRAGFSMWISGKSVIADTATLAICRAALLAIMEEE
jgi:hypothetical protein